MLRPVATFLLLVGSSACQGLGLAPSIPNGQGVNIHFTTPQPGEMEMLAAAGFHWVRTDLSWRTTEPLREIYDFSHYDVLWSALTTHGLHAIFTLDYGNPLYDGGRAPYTVAGRAAFAAWARAAVAHFRGQPILWELYNEPNSRMWKPAPSVADYILLAQAVGAAVHQADPQAMLIGPATSGFDFVFLSACLQAGLLREWAAVSVHPYRSTGPETTADDFVRLRALIAHFEEPGHQVPIISGEWGYSSGNVGVDDQQQGKLLARQGLSNLLNGISLSIWYDWRDDGPPTSTAVQAHYGTVLQPYMAGSNPVFTPKPAFHAAQSLTSALAGFQFSQRLQTASADDYILAFQRGPETRYAAWTTGPPHVVNLPSLVGSYLATSFDGSAISLVATTGQGITLELSDAPLYVSPAHASVAGKSAPSRVGGSGWMARHHGANWRMLARWRVPGYKR